MPKNTTTTKGWPPSRRRAQAAHIRRTKPWLKTTGPRTAAGKARSRMNAYKHGFRTRAFADIRKILRWQRNLVRRLVAAYVPRPQRLDLSLTSGGFHNIKSHPELCALNALRPPGWP